MSIQQLYQDFHIETASEGHKHNRPGWANVACPFCSGDNPGYHLGFNEDDTYYFCWRCGSHQVIPTLSKLLGISYDESRRLSKEYDIYHATKERKISPQIRLKTHRVPSDTGKMKKNHRQYLKKRGFDPEKIEKDWGVLGTGPVSQLDKINYKHRLLIPIYWNKQRVSFQTRDITNRQSLRYISCPKNRELIFHKHIIYGRQEKWTEAGICVEGVFDVWRLGFPAFATFGIEYTEVQVRIIAHAFKRVTVIFDDEPQAQRQAQKLVAELKFRGVDAWNVKIKGDPGKLSQCEAKELVKSISK